MWKEIPGYPEYQFNIATLDVKSLKRKVRSGFGHGLRSVPETILKLSKANGYYSYCFHSAGKQRTLKRSQICWLVYHGYLPEKGIFIDHIDNDRTNDNINNLQLLNNRENISKAFQQNGTEYPTGVHWNIWSGKFQARIQINKKRIHLGYFRSVSEASLVYQKALLRMEQLL